MEVSAFTKNIQLSPRKVKDIADLVRRQTPSQAIKTLKFVQKKGAKPISEILVSALANAKHNFGLSSEVLRIKKLEVLKGPSMKRYRFAAHGRIKPILKRLTHIRVVLESEEEKKIVNTTASGSFGSVNMETSIQEEQNGKKAGISQNKEDGEKKDKESKKE